MQDDDSIKIVGFQASELFEQIKIALKSLSMDEKEKLVKIVKGIYQFDLTNKDSKTVSWVLDLKTPESVNIRQGTCENADVILIWDDESFVGMSMGKISAQKAFMLGKLKSKGNILLAIKLEPIMKQLTQQKSKL